MVDSSGFLFREPEKRSKETALSEVAQGVTASGSTQQNGKQRKTPTYHVFREVSDGSYRLLTGASAVAAASRKQAMRTIADRESDKGDGTRFWAIPEDEYRPRRRSVRQRIEDTFS